MVHNIHRSQVHELKRAGFSLPVPCVVSFSNLIVNHASQKTKARTKFLLKVQCATLQLVPGSKASFTLAHNQATECTMFPSKIQRWLNGRDYLRRFLRQRVEIDLCFKRQQALSDHFGRGQASCGSEKNEHITGKRCLDGSQSKPRMMGHDKIMSPLLYKQKALPQKPVSAKRSLIFALLSMKWD